MVQKIGIVLLLITLLVGNVSTSVHAAEISVDSVNTKSIYGYSEVPLDINPDGSGNLIVSDNGYVIWKINPLSGAYTVYDTALNPVSDAHRVSGQTEAYWFTNNTDRITYTNLVTSYTWEVPPETGQVEKSLGQIEIGPNGEIWAIEYFSTKSKLLKVTRDSNVATICTLLPESGSSDYGTWAYDLILRDNYLWWFNWSADRVVRLNITPDVQGKYTLESWDTDIPVGPIEGRVLDFDQAGNLWVPGGGAGKIYRFNPTSEGLTTFSIPGTTSIEGVTVLDGHVWYADSKGSVGILDPLAAPGIPLDLSSNYHSEKLVIDLPCNVSVADETSNEQTVNGAFTFTPRIVTIDTTHPGLTIMPLASDDALTGINSAQSVVLVSNQKGNFPYTGQLIRFIPTTPSEYKVFLPLIVR